ncbi:transposase [Kitasatospora sp. MMS16-BH015]|uniref:transposase n=1 Tax=Kitasatospora sp. MMS16-BH015 TaxID=2018025 RepID=UPI0020C2EC22|nr:transposase [Kitasatospora sp. MMS16-BH015]
MAECQNFRTGDQARRGHADLCAGLEVELVGFNGEYNRVHLLVDFPSKVTLPKLANSLKGASSRRMRQEYPELVKVRPTSNVEPLQRT